MVSSHYEEGMPAALRLRRVQTLLCEIIEMLLRLGCTSGYPNQLNSFSSCIFYSLNVISGGSSPVLSWLTIYVAYPSQLTLCESHNILYCE